MMGRSHLVVNGALVAVGLTWLSALRDPGSAPASVADAWVTGVVSWPASVIGQAAPGWLGEHPVSGAAQWLWAWLFPFWVGERPASAGFLVAAAALLALGTVLPDVDSKSSLLGRWLPVAFLGPHRGLLHTDWALFALFAASVSPPTRLVVWLWLGAWLHCEIDGFSKLGRVRFYPLARHRLYPLSGGELCVGRTSPHLTLYGSGGVAELALLAGFLLVCGAAMAAALRL